MGEERGEIEKGEHVFIAETNASVRCRGADEFLGVGAVEVNVAAIGICILILKSFEPEDPGEDAVSAFFALPNRAGETSGESRIQRSAVADFFTDDEVAGGGLVGTFTKADSIERAGNGSLE